MPPAAPMTEQSTPTRIARATLREVAQHAGVSPMTASRAIRGEPGVAAVTRDRVLAAVADLGYRRNEVARNLRLGRPDGLLGLVLSNLANPFYAQLAVGVEAAASARNVRVLLAVAADDPAREREVVRELAGRGVDGIVVVSASNTHTAYTPDALGGTPVVLAASPPMGADLDAVILDDFGGAYEATRRLLGAGHDRIGFVGLPPATWTGSERLRGFSAALDEAGIAVQSRYVVRPDRDVADAERATGKLLDAARPPTAIFAANNRNTIGAYRAIRARRAAAALTGFDDVEFADLVAMPLTVVSYDAQDLGARAGTLLLDRVEALGRGEAPPTRRIVVPVRVVDYG
jgi:LacI family transcriptional regulator